RRIPTSPTRCSRSAARECCSSRRTSPAPARTLGGGLRPPSDGRRAPHGALLPVSPQDRLRRRSRRSNARSEDAVADSFTRAEAALGGDELWPIGGFHCSDTLRGKQGDALLGVFRGESALQLQRRRDAMRAPSARAWSFAHTMVGWISMEPANVA